MVTSWMLAMVSMMPMASPDTAMAIASTRTLLHRGMMAKMTEMMRAETNRADRALNNLKVEGDARLNAGFSQIINPG